MNIYLLSQDINDGYDTYNADVVAAASEEKARDIFGFDGGDWVWRSQRDQIKVELIGTTGAARGVILASFNAG